MQWRVWRRPSPCARQSKHLMGLAFSINARSDRRTSQEDRPDALNNIHLEWALKQIWL